MTTNFKLGLFTSLIAACLLVWPLPAFASGEGQGLVADQNSLSPISSEDELILELQIEGTENRDTIIAYGRLPEVYLPFGLISRLLDLAVTVSDDGKFASGWILQEDTTLALEAGKSFFVAMGEELQIPLGSVVAFDGEMYVRPEALETILPVKVKVDIRAQSVKIQTLETFPFQAQQARDNRRNLLNSQQNAEKEGGFTRQEIPYLWYEVPKADIELRGVSDSTRGTRMEGELYLAGDLAAASAEMFLSTSSNDGLTAALLEVGRDDPDGELLGPLNATSFALGDVQSSQQAVGLRSSFGRGVRVTNSPLNAQSVFDEIALRGVLQDGYEVELYRNGILLGSTDRPVNGQYEFLQVPVDFGINSFRLVFYGPQGQKREEVQTIRVGDGRIPRGEFHYDFAVVQNERTLFDVRPSGAVIPPNAGSWRAISNASFGISNNMTLVGSLSFDEKSRFGQEVVSSFGLRTGVGSTGIRFDAAFSPTGAFGTVAGINAQVGGANITLNHAEYANGFVDEQRGSTGRGLARVTDLNLSTSLAFGPNIFVPLIGRAKHLQYADGGQESRASLRTSARLSGFLFSNSIEFADFKDRDGDGNQQLVGNFDLATSKFGNFRIRAALDYDILPQAKPSAVAVITDLDIREKTYLRFSTGYRLDGSSFPFGASVLTRLGKTTLAFEGDYDLKRKSHSVALRWGLSLGKSAQGFYVDEVSRARRGSVEINAFYDRNANGVRDADDEAVPNLTFFSPTETSETDQTGQALLTGLATNRPISVQLDQSSLPDISLVPVSPGFEIVPRRGRTHHADFPIVSVGEIDGTVHFVSVSGKQPVGGVRLGLKPSDPGRPSIWIRSEADGFFYFEQVKPGRYELILDEGQADRLELCLASPTTEELEVPADGGTQSTDVWVSKCPAEQVN